MGGPLDHKAFADASDAAATQGNDPVDRPCVPCTSDNWVKLRYEYADGTGVPGAAYVVQTVTDAGTPTGEVLAEGVTDADGNAVAALPDGHDQVEFYFHADPEGDPYEDPDAARPLEEPEEGFWARLWSTLTEAGDWIWGILKGDFAEDPDTSQIIGRMILTMIPGIDQIADVQDIVHILYKLIWKQEYDQKEHWILLVITLIGLIPVLGSLAKGVLKLVWKRAGDLASVIGVFNFFRKSNAHRWLRDFATDLTGKHLDDAIGLLDTMMARVVHYMNEAKTFFGGLTGWNGLLNDGLVRVGAFQSAYRAKLREAAQDLRAKLLETLAAGMTRIQRTATKNAEPHVVRQEVVEPPERLSRYGATGSASGRPFDPDNAGGPIRRSDWRTATINKDGIADVKNHVSRFDDYPPNQHMIERLERIERGEIPATDYDLKYYTHEIRELQRYRNMGIPDGSDPSYEVWNNAHTATLEDFGLSEKDIDGNSTLFHPDTWGL